MSYVVAVRGASQSIDPVVVGVHKVDVASLVAVIVDIVLMKSVLEMVVVVVESCKREKIEYCPLLC